MSMTFGGGPRGVNESVYSSSASGIAIDATDAVWVVGLDAIPTVPTTPDALEYSSSNGLGAGAGYALKLSPAGSVVYGTYLSRPVTKTVDSVALDGAGNVVIGERRF